MYINYKPIPETSIHPLKKDSLKITYKAEYTEKNEDINIDYSNLKEIDNILDLNKLIEVMFALRQYNKYNIQIGYTIEDNDQWIIEDFASRTEDYKDTQLEVKQSRQLEDQQKVINEMSQKIEQYERFIKKYKAEEMFKQFQKENIFWYELLFRGISPGCQPKDFIEVNHMKGKFGIVAYDRELTEQELKEYEMRPYKN